MDTLQKPIESGLIAVVKQECPTCRLVEPVLRALASGELPIQIIAQDELAMLSDVPVTDDRELELSFHLDVEFVPTIIQRRDGVEQDRTFGWHRGEWERVTGVSGLGAELPPSRPGCGSFSVDGNMREELIVKFGDTGLKSRAVNIVHPVDDAEEMFDRGWTDGLPVITPTPARVLRMLSGTNREPQEHVGAIPPSLADCTVEKVAINAVMAGCRPSYFPVVLAALEAALEPRFSWHGLLSTTMSAGLMIVVNGPVARQIGMNSGMNALGHGNRANSTIARCLQLVAQNIGGAKPGGVDRSTIGHPGKRGVCFAEDETEDGWIPLSVSRGVPQGRSAVTVFGCCGVTVCEDELSRTPESLTRSLVSSLQTVGHAKRVRSYAGMLVLSPEHWDVFKQAGWDRRTIEERILDATKQAGADVVAGAHGVENGMPSEWAEGAHCKFAEDQFLMVRAGSRAGMMSVVVTGWGGGGTAISYPITKEVRQ